jgi:hypothetical protein
MRPKRIVLILVLVACLLLTHSVLAMSSSNYQIDWMVPLSGSGGRASSTNYAAQLTIGQTATGTSTSPGFQAGWGFWHGIRQTVWELFLPLLQRR